MVPAKCPYEQCFPDFMPILGAPYKIIKLGGGLTIFVIVATQNNMVLRRIFGPRRDEVTEEWRRLHNRS